MQTRNTVLSVGSLAVVVLLLLSLTTLAATAATFSDDVARPAVSSVNLADVTESEIDAFLQQQEEEAEADKQWGFDKPAPHSGSGYGSTTSSPGKEYGGEKEREHKRPKRTSFCPIPPPKGKEKEKETKGKGKEKEYGNDDSDSGDYDDSWSAGKNKHQKEQPYGEDNKKDKKKEEGPKEVGQCTAHGCEPVDHPCFERQLAADLAELLERPLREVSRALARACMAQDRRLWQEVDTGKGYEGECVADPYDSGLFFFQYGSRHGHGDFFSTHTLLVLGIAVVVVVVIIIVAVCYSDNMKRRHQRRMAAHNGAGASGVGAKF